MFGGFGTQVRAGRFDAGAEFVFRSGCEVLNLLSNEVEDGSFVRLNALYAGYTIKNARLFLQAGNLFVVSAYRGYDPEVSSLGHSAPGIDRSSYPRALTVSAGLKISL